MRAATAVGLALLLAPAAGCGPRPDAAGGRAPLAAGKVEGGSHWKNPLSSVSNEGSEFEKGSRVEVYDQVIVVTAPGGSTRVVPHGYYSGLVFRKE